MIAKRLLVYAIPGLILFILRPCAMALQTTQTDSSGSTSSSRGDPSRLPSSRPLPGSSRSQRQDARTVFVSGTVVREDGLPLPVGVVIERLCAGRVKREANVNSTGSFSFQVGGIGTNGGLLPEASEESGLGLDPFVARSPFPSIQRAAIDPMSPGNLMGCEVRARLAGYRSSTVVLDGFHEVGRVDVGTIVLHPIARVQGTTVSVTQMQAPRSAKKALARADKAVKKNNLAEAEKNLKAAVEAYPDYAAAWYTLGQVYQLRQRAQDARQAYTRAIAADSKYVNPYIRLAGIAGMEQNWQEVVEITNRVLALDPLDFPEAYCYNALAYYSLDILDRAEGSARKAQRLDPLHRFPRMHIILANILQRKRDIPGTIEQLQYYLKFAPKAGDADEIRSRIQQLERLPRTLASSQPESS